MLIFFSLTLCGIPLFIFFGLKMRFKKCFIVIIKMILFSPYYSWLNSPNFSNDILILIEEFLLHFKQKKYYFYSRMKSFYKFLLHHMYVLWPVCMKSFASFTVSEERFPHVKLIWAKSSYFANFTYSICECNLT